MARSKTHLTKKEIRLLLTVVFVIISLVSAYLSNQKNDTVKVSSDVSGTVTVLDIGQGDSILLSSGGRYALIDAATSGYADTLCNKIRKSGSRSLDVMLLTHNHDDHVGGAEMVADRFSIYNLILPNLTNTESKTRIINAAKSEVLASDGECYTAKQGMFFNIGDIKLTVLSCYTEFNNENDRSVITMADIGGVRFLLTGDAESPNEKRMIAEGIDLDCDVLKAGHHGSGGACSTAFLKECTPRFAAISCGTNNQYNHPHDDAIKRLKNIGAKIYRTDKQGDITFTVRDGKLSVDTEK